MNDIELTNLINNLEWKIDLEKGACESVLVRYRIIEKKGYIDLKSEWISPDMPTVATVINDIQRSAVTALKRAKESHQ
ncbi:MAG: hypothetical protein LBQ89_08175 [Treponema sp.]|jgi:hypothetical protein|nr:hypothetical protein [Treponema sp.]